MGRRAKPVVMATEANWNARGLIFSAWIALAAPAVGFIATTFQVRSAFQRTSTVDPPEKARTLAEGISTSMNAAAFGSGIGFLALCAAALFGFRLYRESKQKKPEGGPGSSI
jgi:biopolymer transport protein ExbB/TolQ